MNKVNEIKIGLSQYKSNFIKEADYIFSNIPGEDAQLFSLT